MNTIKLIAVDLDGPLLIDTFSPLLLEICKFRGIEYTSEVESKTFSQPRDKVVEYLKEIHGHTFSQDELDSSTEDYLQTFFVMREEFMKNNKKGMREGVPKFIEMIASTGIKMISYGGLNEEYMREELGEYANAFDQYVCTNDFRPGLREIVKDIYKLEFSEVLFIDDVNSVAKHAKELGTPFIGIPSKEPWSWQKKDMIKTGVRYIYDSLGDIDLSLLEKIDIEAGKQIIWEREEVGNE